jgi:3-phosphoshikimate 1-carboxyvinyltransferase
MKVSINKSEVTGKVVAPSSKSYTIRALMCAALAKGVSEIVHPLGSDDTAAALNVLGKLGVLIGTAKDSWRVTGGGLREAGSDLFCGDSAATLRFMTAICSLVPGKSRLTAGPSLSRRPVQPLLDTLKQLGVNCSAPGGLPPVMVEGGKLKGGEVELPGNISSQFVSALLFISPFAGKGMTIRLTTPLESKAYVLMTLDCLQQFMVTVGFSEELTEFETIPQRYQPARYEIEGDWSSASYFLALGAVSGEVEVANLDLKSCQGDKMILDFLTGMGAPVNMEKNSVTVKSAKLKAIKADLTDCIDLLPTMAVLAAVADGVSELTGIERARLKESDRVQAVKEGLERMGIKVAEDGNKLTITGSTPKSAVIDSKGDHRIAMAFSILGAVAGATVIDGAECVSKTYPSFWDDLARIGVKVKIDGQ